jgi:hypothetical protein
VFWIDAETRDHLVAADSATFFVTEHYRNSVAVQARLDKVSAGDIARLMKRAIERVSRRS